MTDSEFDNTPFRSGDKIIVRKYFGTEHMTVHRIDFDNRTVNGFLPKEIITHITHTHNEQKQQ